ncbi:GNAT family N-acetyltransferase [Marinicella meishanensis]|uniref:GNAT family N-acetyltransferase n=1 Tax=Marinicella meishanensis TaxID=2873263 RepID=UPI001CC079B8
MFELQTQRLRLTELSPADGPFIQALFTDPDCLRFIGDRGITDLASAETYLKDRLMASYREHGFGLYKVTLLGADTAMGICGLVKRDADNPPDIGFAFLPAHRGGGYCTEAAQAILDWAQQQRISDTILAYTNPENAASIHVLEKIGLQRQTITTLPGQDFPSLILQIRIC